MKQKPFEIRYNSYLVIYLFILDFKPKIRKIGQIVPSNDFKEQAKNRLMQRIRQTESSWLETMLYSFQEIKMNQSFHANSRERLIYQMNTSSFLPTWIANFFFNKKLWSVVITTCFFFVSFFAYSIQSPQRVEASNEVYLYTLTGTPLIKHLGGNWEPAKQTLELRIGDKIQTQSNDIVEILFFDNSITRLDGNTEITISTFSKEHATELISLELIKGKIWNKVIQAVSDTSNFIVKTHNSAVSAQNATFDIEVESNTPTKINVIDHIIDVEIIQTATDNVVAKTKVIEGYAVEVQTSEEKTMAQAAQIVPIEDDYKQNAWFTENISKDAIFIKDLQKKHTDNILASAGTLPGSMLYPVKQTIKNAKEIITNPDKDQQIITTLKKKLQEYAALVTASDQKQTTALLFECNQLFQEAANQTKLQPQLQKMIVELQVDYVTILPDSTLYRVKEVLHELQIQVSNEANDLLSKRKTEKLFEIQDLIQNNSIELASTLLASLNQENFSQTTSGTTILNNDSKRILLLQKSEELQIIQNLKQQIGNIKEQQVLVSLLEDIQNNTVNEMNSLSPPLSKPPSVAVKTIQKITTIDKSDKKISKAEEFIEKINIYKNERGQTNAIVARLKKIPNNSNQISLLIEIKKSLPLKYQHFVTQKIIEISKEN